MSPYHLSVPAVAWRDGQCVLLDQTRLPREERYFPCDDYRQVVDAIRRLAVRGAPAIGVAGAYGCVLAAREAARAGTREERVARLRAALDEIASARPTAVNLRWAVERQRRLVAETPDPVAIESRLLAEAEAIHRDDAAANRRMAELGCELLAPGTIALTYCNTGDLATGGLGTALGVLTHGHRVGRVAHVYTCETRPVLQGLRLTAWELQRAQVPFTAICDNMAAITMRDRGVNAVLVGADRIAANGDAANKVGTYTLAVLAKHHGVPFYVVAPSSTFDLATPSGDAIPIEERAAEEIYAALGDNRHPTPVPVFNPSFDVTPASLITGIICEKAVFRPPYGETIRRALG